ncbi:MAG: RidA family protein, partial [Microcoleus sp. SIO2G3]|nr:RidA family protein [Microcoleus sp. SIO2G3]
QQLTAVVQAIWGEQTPTQTLIPVPRLALDGMLFEVDAVAVIPNS